MTENLKFLRLAACSATLSILTKKTPKNFQFPDRAGKLISIWNQADLGKIILKVI
jgi:hypothetical protein